MRRTWNCAFSSLLQYLLTQKCNRRGSSLCAKMEPACVLVPPWVGGRPGSFSLLFSLDYLGSECFLPFGLRWRKNRGNYDRKRERRGEREKTRVTVMKRCARRDAGGNARGRGRGQVCKAWGGGWSGDPGSLEEPASPAGGPGSRSQQVTSALEGRLALGFPGLRVDSLIEGLLSGSEAFPTHPVQSRRESAESSSSPTPNTPSPSGNPTK